MSFINDDLDKRLREIKHLIQDNNKETFKSPIWLVSSKSAILFIYAHWEGFIKKVWEYFLNKIKERNIDFIALKSCFITEYKKEISNNSWKIIDDLLSWDFLKTWSLSSKINTAHNLYLNIFKDNVLKRLWLDYKSFMELIFKDIFDVLLSSDKFSHDKYIYNKIYNKRKKWEISWTKNDDKVKKILKRYKIWRISYSEYRDFEKMEEILKIYVDWLVGHRNDIAHWKHDGNFGDRYDIELYWYVVEILLSKFLYIIEASLDSETYKK